MAGRPPKDHVRKQVKLGVALAAAVEAVRRDGETFTDLVELGLESVVTARTAAAGADSGDAEGTKTAGNPAGTSDVGCV